MVGIFPQLADVPLLSLVRTCRDDTRFRTPCRARRRPRLYSVGYNGAGVAMSSLMGRYLAAFARGETADVGLLDARRVRTVPFYPLREPAVRMVAGWYQFLDAIGR